MDQDPASLKWWTHQQNWLSDRSRFRICLKARQCGMSTVIAAEAVADAVAGHTTVLASASERQSRELMRRCLKLLSLVTAASAGAISVEKESGDALELSTGGRVISVPASAATVQGFSASVVLDEAAWMANGEELWQALAPSITASSRNRLSVLSTPRGKGGFFHRLWTNADAVRWSRHKITIDDAIAGGCEVDRDELRAAIADENVWRACFLCEFIDEQYSLLPYDLLAACTDESLPYHASMPDLASHGDVYVGVDIGRVHDLTVFAFIELGAKEFISRGFVEMRGAAFDVQEVMLGEALKRRNVRRCVIDATGMGLQLAERATQRWGWRIVPVTLSHPIKEDLCARMQRAFQRREIRIPNHQALLTDLHSVERSITAAGNVRYAAASGPGGHADRFMALALAISACDKLLGVPKSTRKEPVIIKVGGW